MNYTDRNGNTATGTVWSPGPLANTVWVLDDNGTPVVVKLPKGDVSKAEEQDYALPEFADGMGHGARWMHNNGSDFRGLPRLSCVDASTYRNAPKLPNKTWNAAVAGQCVQGELIAA